MSQICIVNVARKGSNSEKILNILKEELDVSILNILDEGYGCSDALERVIFLLSAQGDGEMTIEMEKFILNNANSIKDYTILEIGNYYGFDDWGFGPGKKIINALGEGSTLIFSPLSLDTLPAIDYSSLYKWVTCIKEV